jgi:hypothetical protein
MRTFVAITLSCLFAVARGDAKELVLVCPSEIPAEFIRDVEIQSGWMISNPNRLKLQSASFSGGRPEERRDLVPFQVSKHRGSAYEQWKFDGDEVWLRCAYGAAGQIALSKKVEGKQTECSITYDRDSPSRIVCSDG